MGCGSHLRGIHIVTGDNGVLGHLKFCGGPHGIMARLFFSQPKATGFDVGMTDPRTPGPVSENTASGFG